MDLYPTLAFSKLWHKTLALTVLQTTMLAPPTMSTSASDDGNPNLRSPTDDGSAQKPSAAKERATARANVNHRCQGLARRAYPGESRAPA